MAVIVSLYPTHNVTYIMIIHTGFILFQTLEKRYKAGFTLGVKYYAPYFCLFRYSRKSLEEAENYTTSFMVARTGIQHFTPSVNPALHSIFVIINY